MESRFLLYVISFQCHIVFELSPGKDQSLQRGIDSLFELDQSLYVLYVPRWPHFKSKCTSRQSLDEDLHILATMVNPIDDIILFYPARWNGTCRRSERTLKEKLRVKIASSRSTVPYYCFQGLHSIRSFNHHRNFLVVRKLGKYLNLRNIGVYRLSPNKVGLRFD